MTDLVPIAGPRLSAEVNPLGAELWRLRDADGRDLLWDGDPAWWTGRAPILFPVVGAVADGLIRVDGRTYPMAKHGFARRSRWAVVAQEPDAATFRLAADATTRAAYPFDFRLEVRFAVEGAALAVTAELHNPGAEPLPASFGFHPALRWPLPGGQPRAAHQLRFVAPEPAPVRRIGMDGLLRPDPAPTPIAGDLLQPRDELFEDDALILDRPASRAVTFGAPGGTTLRLSFPAMPHLGIWTRPGAPFLCIEPWQGMADPQGYAGEFRDKPGVVAVPAGGTRRFTLRVEVA